MVCTYSSNIFEAHTSETDAYLKQFEEECRSLHTEFTNRTITTNVEVFLSSAGSLQRAAKYRLDKRLKTMQAI